MRTPVLPDGLSSTTPSLLQTSRRRVHRLHLAQTRNGLRVYPRVQKLAKSIKGFSPSNRTSATVTVAPAKDYALVGNFDADTLGHAVSALLVANAEREKRAEKATASAK